MSKERREAHAGARVPALTLLAGDQSAFAFDEAYILDRERRTLSLSFKTRRSV